MGELGCAYADGCLTREQTIILGYYYGVALSKCASINGSMAIVGKETCCLKKIKLLIIRYKLF